MDHRPRNVLIIAFDWPPSAAVGAVRPAKLARHLLRHGWNPIVVTAKEQYYEQLNTGADAGNRDMLVRRTGCLTGPLAIYSGLKKGLFKLVGREDEWTKSTLIGKEGKDPQLESRAFLSVVRRLILSLLDTPDQLQGWLPPAVAAAVRIVKTHQVPCVISTGPPLTAHLVGLVLKKICKIYWVADFRDPWRYEQRPFWIDSSLAQNINAWLEMKVMVNADRVVCVTPAMTEFYQKMYPQLASEKWMTIANGFDPEEFRQLGAVLRYPKFTISYLGVFEYGRTPDSFIRAAGELLREGIFERDRLSIRFIGKCRYAVGQSVQEMVDQAGLKDVVKIVDLLPRHDAMREMLRSHVLLLLANQQRLQVPGKAYEYLAAGTHILAVAEEKGATADLINRVGVGAVVPPGDHESIKRILKAWYAEYKGPRKEEHGSTNPKQDIIKEYEWSELGARYATALNECRASCGERT